MKMFGRRVFAKSAPVAAAAGASAFANLTIPAPTTERGIGMNQALDRCSPAKAVADPEYAKHQLFQKAMRKAVDPTHFRSRIRDQHAEQTTIPPNIAALRSISPQHKIHMTLKYNDDMTNENQSWVKSIADSVGLSWEKVRGMLY